MDMKLYASLQYKYFVRHHLLYKFISNILDMSDERKRIGATTASFKILPFKRFLEKFDIGNAFCWEDTKEGVDFWLHHKKSFDEEIRIYEKEHNTLLYNKKCQ